MDYEFSWYGGKVANEIDLVLTKGFKSVIVECKAVSEVLGNHRAQLFNYMRILQKQCGVLVNFYPFSAQVERYFYDKDTHQIVATDGHVIYNYDRRMRVSSM